MPEKPYIGVVQFAEQVGMTSQYIRRLIKQGKITKSSLITEGKRKLVHPKKAMADIENNVSYLNKKNPKTSQSETKKETPKRTFETEQEDERPRAQEKVASIINAAGLANANLSEAQTIKERYAAALKKLEYEEKSKTLVKASTVEKEAFTMARMTRDSIMAVVDRNAAVLAAETDEKLVADTLRNELLQALELLAAG